jgi:DNA-binding response OmpR family regulator
MKKILLVEDDPAILEGLTTVFQDEGFEVLTAADGVKGLASAKEDNPDIIILDIMLPKMNGMDVLKAIRSDIRKQVPVILLTSKKEEIDKVMGLEFGADDYVTKPFSIRELIARIKAVLRRAGNELSEKENFLFGDVEVNFKHQEVNKNGAEIHLSVTEFRILSFFITHSEEIVSREMLLDEVWGYDSFPTTRTVDNFILTLRKHIENNPSEPKHILTVHRAGYKFKP